MTNAPSQWEHWLSTLPQDERSALIALRDHFAGLGADAPEDWAQSEISEGIPQLARFLILRRLWDEGINGWEQPGAIENLPAARRLLEGGADRTDLINTMRASAFEAIFIAIGILEGHSQDPDNAMLPGWCLQETDPKGHPTGRRIGGLYEDLRGTDPSGRDAEDLWA
ncbi:hypothetical protein [Actinocorallia aurantiaca]|uniref:Uncharacterized protein n=1 Tax=Actinocorallia aurantiaca TaxID=46204 RepID=A0ABN3UUA7_9ACTN